LLLSLLTTVPIAKAIQLIKAGSWAWIHQTFRRLHNFSWQQGYGAFRVRVSQLPETIHDIQNQVEHHRTRTFPQEYLAFLKRHEHSTHSTGCRLLRGGALPACSCRGSVSTTNICGTDNAFDRPSGTGLSASLPRHFVPGYYQPVPPGPCSLDIFLCVFQAPEGRTENSPGLRPWESKDDMSRQAATPVATLSAV
jgi:hypothetical protein